MIRVAARMLWLFGGLLWLIGLADQHGWLSPVWAKFLPEVVLARPLTARELQMAQLGKQIEAGRAELKTLQEARRASQEKRHALLGQLRKRLRYSAAPFNESKPIAKSVAERDRVVRTLVWSVDAEVRQGSQIDAKIQQAQTEVEHMEARLTALQNGLSQVEPTRVVRPTDELVQNEEIETSADRFRQILREAMESTN